MINNILDIEFPSDENDITTDNLVEINCENIQSLNDSLSGHTEEFLILNTNIRSLNKNFDEFLLNLALFSVKPNIICLTETWNCEKDIILTVPNYNSYSSTTYINKSSGITLFLDEKCKDVRTKDVIIDGACCYICEFNFLRKSYRLICIYRSPSESEVHEFIENLSDLLTIIRNENVECTDIILGDLNVDICENPKNEYIKNLYLNTVVEHGYVSCINQITRKYSESCLDHILLRDRKGYDKYKKILGLVWKSEITDHYTSLLCLSKKHPSDINEVKSQTTQRKNTKINYEGLIGKMKEETWCRVFSSKDVNEVAENFHGILTSYIEASSEPMVITKKLRALKPWITPGLLKSIREKEKLSLKLRKSPFDKYLKSRYNKFKNKLTYLIRLAREAYFSKRIEEAGSNPRARWSAIHEALGQNQKRSEINSITSEGKLMQFNREGKEIANVFNRHFSTVGERLADDTMVSEDPVIPEVQEDGPFWQVSEETIGNLISGLRGGSSPGFDGITAVTLKKIKNYITKPLTYLINLSCETCVFPNIYKKAVITPLFKTGDPKLVNNYRPISLLSNLAKIIEKALKIYLLDYMKTQKIIHENQFGFQEGKSTLDAIMSLVEKITLAVDEGDKVMVVYKDMTKAFDTVPHTNLIETMILMNFHPKFVRWVKSYLTNREQVVKIGETLSDSCSFRFSVPQGTVLAPLYYIIYCNGIFSRNIDGDVICFADDSALIVRGNTWEEVKEKATKNLTELIQFMKSRNLKLNYSKTNFMAFSWLRSSIPNMGNIVCHIKSGCLGDCGCPSIKQVEKTRYLGVIVDQCLSWDEHIKELAAKLRKLIPICRGVNFMNVEVKRQVYYAMVQSLLNYASPIWGTAYKTKIQTILVTQKTLIKILLKKPRRFPSDKLFLEFKVLDIHHLIEQTTLIYTYKQYLEEKVERVNVGTRSADSVTLKARKVKTTGAQRLYFHKGVILYNILPIELLRKEKLSLTVFKSRIKKYYFSILERDDT